MKLILKNSIKKITYLSIASLFVSCSNFDEISSNFNLMNSDILIDEENICFNELDNYNNNEILQQYISFEGFDLYDEKDQEMIDYSEIYDTIETLSEREAEVLKLRFGMKDGISRTLEQVGKDFGVTRERIRQIESKALRKLRHPKRSKKLRGLLY